MWRGNNHDVAPGHGLYWLRRTIESSVEVLNSNAPGGRVWARWFGPVLLEGLSASLSADFSAFYELYRYCIDCVLLVLDFAALCVTLPMHWNWALITRLPIFRCTGASILCCGLHGSLRLHCIQAGQNFPHQPPFTNGRQLCHRCPVLSCETECFPWDAPSCS